MIRLNRYLQRLARWLMYLAAVAGTAMAVFVALSSIMRYLLGTPFRFTEELVGLLFAAMIFLTLPVCAMRRSHIRVTLVRDLMPGIGPKLSDIAAGIFTILFCVIFGALSYDFAEFSYRIGSATDMSGILLYPWMGLMPLGIGLMGVATALRGVAAWFDRAAADAQDEQGGI